jgi:nucleotide-binding universal stress UspA family protein
VPPSVRDEIATPVSERQATRPPRSFALRTSIAPDVVVVGSPTSGWFAAVFSGSVSSQVVKESEVPVLAVK